MMKYLVVIGVIWAVYYFFIKKQPISQNSYKKNNTKDNANDMVECETCGTYVEIDEAIISNGKYYCSKECVR